MSQNRQLLVPVRLALMLFLGVRASGQTLYYATSSASQDRNSVQHVTPGGAANTSVLTATGSGGNNVSRCTAIALDTSLQKIFLVDAGNQELWSMNWDGSSLNLVKAGLTNTPTDLALDTVNQMIYYTTSSATQINNTIQRMDYTGNNNTVLFTAGASGNNVSRCTALALDLKNSLIIFSDAGVNGLWSLNLSGSGLTLITSNLTAAPLDLALDVTNQFIYYATSSSVQNSNTVQKLNYAGNANTLLFTATGATGNGVSRCTAIEFDPADSKLYLADAGTNALWSLNSDGSGLSQVEPNLLPTPRRVRFIPPVAPPTIYTWNNPAGGNWNLAGNWNPATGVPGPSDTAIISDSGSYTVTVSDKEAVGTLTMSGTSGTQTLNISGGGTLSINGASTGNANAIVEISGGTLNGIGRLMLAGPLDWSGGVIENVVQCNGGTLSGVDELDGGQLINLGTLAWNGSIYDGDGSVISNTPSGTINLAWSGQTYFTFPDFGAPQTFYNAGQLNVSAGSGNTGYIYGDALTNSGTVSIGSGTLNLAGGGANAGAMSVTAGTAALQVSAGTFNFNSGSTLTDTGSLIFSGGTVNVAGTVSVAGTNLLSGGTVNVTGDYPITTLMVVSGSTVNLNGSGSLTPPVLMMSGGTLTGNPVTINGPLDWSGGVIENVVQCNGGTLSGVDELDGGQLINLGTLAWNGSIYDGDGSVISNAPSGTINLAWSGQTYFTFPDFGAPQTFYNAGQLNVSAGSGNTGYIYGDALTNSGTVSIGSGTLNLAGGGANTGAMSVTAGTAALQVSAGTFNFNSGSTLTDTGSLIFSGGTVNVAGTVSVAGTNLLSGGTVNVTGDYPITTLMVVSGSTVNLNGSGSLTPPVLMMSGGTLTGNPVTINGPLDWSGGVIENVVQCNGGTLSGVDELDGGQLINLGTLAWNGSIYDGDGSVISNTPSGTIDLAWSGQTYFTFPDFGAPQTFCNAGQLNVSAGSGNTGYIYDALANSGTVTINSGTLSLSQTPNLANGTLSFGISNLTSFGSVSFSGPADLGGTLSATFNDPTFAPAANDMWQVMTYSSLNGVFSKINLPPIAVWQRIAGSTTYKIQIEQLGSGYQPVIVQDLAPTNYALVGAPAFLSVQVEGNPPFTNQWDSEAGEITNALNNGDRGGRVTVATTSLNSSNAELSLTISNAQTSDAGPYQVFVTNGFAPYLTASSAGQLVVELEPLFNVNGSLWTLNGGATIQNNVLTLTDGQPGGEARSVFFNFPMYCQAFSVSFTYQSEQGTSSLKADGVTFCLQNTATGTEAVGMGGGSLGYTGITNSMAIAIDQFNAKGYEYVTNGQDPATLGQYVQTTPAVDPGSGDPINVSIIYETNAISLSLTDMVTLGTFVTNFAVGPLPITGATAFVGFTGGSGDLDSMQTISNFSFVPIPTISAALRGANVLVSWPTGIGGYQLQGSTNLNTPNWLTMPGPYNAVGQQYQLVIPPTANAFYRLALP